MGVGVTNPEPITAMRAILEIEDNGVVDSPYRTDDGREQKQFAAVLKVISGAGERNGETFPQWFSFPVDGKIGSKSKAGQVLTATLEDEAEAETLEELAEKMIGKRFAAQIGTSKDGQYSRIVHDTIGPAPPETGQANGSPRPDDGSGPENAGQDDDEEGFSDLPF